MGCLWVMARPRPVGGYHSKRPGSATVVGVSQRPPKQTYSSVRGFTTPVRLKRRTRHARLARGTTRELNRCLVRIASASRCAGKPESFRQRPRSYPRLVNSVGHLPIVFRHFQQSGTLRRWQVFTRDDFAIDGVGLETYCQFARRPNCHGCPPDPKPEFTLGQGWTPRPRNSIPGGCGLRGQPLPSGGFGQDQLQGTASGLGRLLGGLDARAGPSKSPLARPGAWIPDLRNASL